MKPEHLELRQLYESCQKLLLNDIENAEKRMAIQNNLIHKDGLYIDNLKGQLTILNAKLTALNKKTEV